MHVLVLFACFVGVVCMREIERDRERERVCVCLREREREAD